MKQKIMILIVLCILLSGCTVNYNLNIKDSKITENIILNSNTKENYRDNSVCNNYKKISESNLVSINKNNVTIEKDNLLKLNNVGYYNLKYIKEDNCMLNASYTYNLSEYQMAYTTPLYLQNFEIDYIDDNNYSIRGKNFLSFYSYSNLEELIVNITINDNVVYNTADNVNNNTYSWTINKENYDQKVVKIVVGEKLNENKPQIDYSIYDADSGELINKEETNPEVEQPKKDNTKTIIICGSLIFIGLIAYIIFSKKEKNKYK